MEEQLRELYSIYGERLIPHELWTHIPPRSVLDVLNEYLKFDISDKLKDYISFTIRFVEAIQDKSKLDECVEYWMKRTEEFKGFEHGLYFLTMMHAMEYIGEVERS